MAVIVPLRVEVTLEMRGIVVVLQHKVDMPARLGRGAHSCGHLIYPILLLDRMNGVEAQTVEAIFHQPVQHVFA